MCSENEKEKTVETLEKKLAQLRVALKDDGNENYLQKRIDREADPVDVGAQTTLRRQDMSLAERNRARTQETIERIEHVLTRFYQGWDGTCECGEDIPAGRLITSPGTMHCCHCKEKEELQGKQQYATY